jgi:ABC-type Fe3+-hydroxamate transport system substrate-binding protein
MPKIGKYSREQAVGKIKNAAGKTVIFTKGGVKIKEKAGDVAKTNKKGESVIVRKNGNRVITQASGRIVRVKKDGTRVVTLAKPEMDMVPAGVKPVKGSKINPPVKKK